MLSFHKLPIKQKLMLVIMLTSTVALLVAGVVAITYQFRGARQALVRELSTQAEVIGANCTAALAFNSPKGTADTLDALKVRPEITAAWILKPDGSVFARYTRDENAPATAAPALGVGEHQFGEGQVVLRRPIVQTGVALGSICLQASLRDYQARLKTGANILGWGLIISALVALALSAKLQRVISEPILGLARVAGEVTQRQDYSLRAPKTSADEIGRLTDGFNSMLAQIQKRDEDLRTSEERFRQLAENIEEVFWMSNVDKSRMLYVSPAYEKVWDRSCASLYAAPESWLDAIHPDDRDRVVQAAHTQADGHYDEFYRIVRPDGVVRWIRDRAFPIRDVAGNVYRIAGIAEDVTTRKQMEAQLIQAEKMESVGRLAAGIAHEVKNPLMMLMMGVEYLAQINSDKGETAAVFADMQDAIQRASSIISGLLDFSKPTELHVEFEDLNALLDRALGLVRHDFMRNRISVVRELTPDLPPLPLDKSKIEQVFINLFINATHAMPRGGTVTVRSQRNGTGTVHVEIDDTGPGIPEHQLSQVFDPFFTTKAPGVGTGLGLTVVKQIIELHGGTIELRNRAAGGLRVSLKLQTERKSQA